MRILFVVPYAPIPIRVRSFSIIRELAARGHRVTVASNWSDESERRALEALRGEVDQVWSAHLPRRRSLWNCLLAVPSRMPLQSVYSWNPELASKLEDELSHNSHERVFDVIHVEHLRGARYGLRLQRFLKGRRQLSNTPIVWDSVDCISLLFEMASEESRRLDSRFITRMELGRTRRFEKQLLSSFQHVLVTSPVDRQALLALASNGHAAPVSVLTNGVDLRRFSPAGQSVRVPHSIILSGKMSYHANHSMVVHFVDRILPLIRAELPSVKVWVVGKDPARSIIELSRQPGIEVTGEVPNIAEYMRKASLAAVPILYGVGVQNKVLEAMACATPVIASSQAVSALDILPGRDLITADRPADFARAAVDLLRSPQEREALGRAGRSFVENRHSWGMLTKTLEEVYDAARLNAR